MRNSRAFDVEGMGITETLCWMGNNTGLLVPQAESGSLGEEQDPRCASPFLFCFLDLSKTSANLSRKRNEIKEAQAPHRKPKGNVTYPMCKFHRLRPWTPYFSVLGTQFLPLKKWTLLLPLHGFPEIVKCSSSEMMPLQNLTHWRAAKAFSGIY